MRARKGDTRPLTNDGCDLVLCPSRPFRWLPRHGHPFCFGEWTSQRVVKVLARPSVYFSIVALVAGLVAAFGMPFVSG